MCVCVCVCVCVCARKEEEKEEEEKHMLNVEVISFNLMPRKHLLFVGREGEQTGVQRKNRQQ